MILRIWRVPAGEVLGEDVEGLLALVDVAQAPEEFSIWKKDQKMKKASKGKLRLSGNRKHGSEVYNELTCGGISLARLSASSRTASRVFRIVLVLA